MKKILLLLLPFVLLSCASKTPEPPDQSAPTVASETMETTSPSPEPEKIATSKPKPISSKTETKNDSDTETDKMAKEIDNIFDELING